MEALFKVRYWDYSNRPFNFRGHICLTSSIAWGFLTILMTRVVHRPISDFILSLPGRAVVYVTALVTIYMVMDFTLSFKAALDLRDILAKMQRIKEEMERMSRRLDVIIAFNNEEKEQKKQERELSLSELSMGIKQRFASLKEIIQLKPAEYGENIREEVAELRGKFSHYLDPQENYKEILDFYKRDMIRNNPGMVSRTFKNVLEELKNIAGRGDRGG